MTRSAEPELLHCNVHPEHTATKGQKKGWCPHCLQDVANAPDATTLTREQRLAEWDRWMGPMWIPFDALHKRLEELLGGPIWTHELARPQWIRERIAKGDSGRQDVDPLETLTEIAGDKPVIAVEVPS